jgi:hypothetical protein
MGQIFALALALTVLEGCSLQTTPLLMDCPDKPFIVGEVDGDNVILRYEDAVALQQWIDGTMICKDSNILMLKEQIR